MAGPQTPSPLEHTLPWSGAALCRQLPLAGSQLSIVQEELSPHSFGAPATQLPALHASPALQGLPSLQGPAIGACWHWATPAARLQPSAVHGLPSSQETALPLHLPPWHWSPPLQALPSSHGAPLALGLVVHFPPLHCTVVQGPPSAQNPAAPGLGTQVADHGP
jgi:hypothetical protein